MVAAISDLRVEWAFQDFSGHPCLVVTFWNPQERQAIMARHYRQTFRQALP